MVNHPNERTADITKIAQDLNEAAKQIRREGSVPHFHHEIALYVVNKTFHQTYEGPFEYAEVRDGFLVVQYDHGTVTKFRPDQVGGMTVE